MLRSSKQEQTRRQPKMTLSWLAAAARQLASCVVPAARTGRRLPLRVGLQLRALGSALPAVAPASNHSHQLASGMRSCSTGRMLRMRMSRCPALAGRAQHMPAPAGSVGPVPVPVPGRSSRRSVYRTLRARCSPGEAHAQSPAGVCVLRMMRLGVEVAGCAPQCPTKRCEAVCTSVPASTAQLMPTPQPAVHPMAALQPPGWPMLPCCAVQAAVGLWGAAHVPPEPDRCRPPAHRQLPAAARQHPQAAAGRWALAGTRGGGDTVAGGAGVC